MKTRDAFITIRTEGGLLPAGFIQRLAAGDRTIEGLLPQDYGLGAGERTSEAVSRSWNRLLGVYKSFRAIVDKLLETDPGTTPTREKWLLVLFYELGYGRLQPHSAVEVEGKSYPISHFHLINEKTVNPIHLVGWNVEIDRRTASVAGAARTSPHSLVQEFLNRSDDHLWAFVSNGRRLRILRDNVSLTRQAFVEFDLEGMMEGELFADFAVLWHLCHASRVDAPRPEECLLEKWTRTAQAQGIRALDSLRTGVEEAIKSLGAGFLEHSGNSTLKEKLRSGALSTRSYYHQSLRLVYRLMFLFVAEDRDLLAVPGASADAKERYIQFYSVTRLRRLAEKRRGSKHPDLYRGLCTVMALLGGEGCPDLSLPALGSFLWSNEAVADIIRCDITNRRLLEAVRALAFTVERNALMPIDYRNLGSEELGSIYESLLELHPEIDSNSGHFELRTAAGHERKTTGSYYTPPSLVNCLLDSALDPVLDEAAKKREAEKAILNLKVCDPACGSGHFLVAAAHRMAKRLAAVRTGDDEPSPEFTRAALRDVIGHCIYGVDINPMSVELCKVSLWMEALEPGKPLSFIENRIQCGNSLLGATPALLAKGIPDEAFTPIEGDDKKLCGALKNRNKEERRGQQTLFDGAGNPWDRLGDLATTAIGLDGIDDSTIEGIRKKQKKYEAHVRSTEYEFGRLWADAWCSAFVWKKANNPNIPEFMTTEVFRRIERNPHHVNPLTRAEVRRLAEQYAFFHWHLAFPGVFRVPKGNDIPDNEHAGWIGGFDVVIGNPPWERIKLQELEWFAERNPDIATAPNAAARKRMIEALKTQNPIMHTEFLEDHRKAEGDSILVRNSGMYPLCGRGDINTYTIFAELNRYLINRTGRVGCIVPSGIATDDTTKYFFQDIIQSHSLMSLYDFENKEGLFAGVHAEQKFCLLTLAGNRQLEKHDSRFVFFAHNVDQLNDSERVFTLTAEDISLLNPNTRTCPIFRSSRDAELTKAIYHRVPVLIKEGETEENPCGIKVTTQFHMSNDSHLFRTKEQLEADGLRLRGNIFRGEGKLYLPLYEGKLTHIYDHRYATFADVKSDDIDKGNERRIALFEHVDCEYLSLSRFYILEEDYISCLQRQNILTHCLTFHGITNPNNERTFIATICPAYPAGNSLPILMSINDSASGMRLEPLLAVLNSFILDYVSRLKIGSRNVNFFIVKQLPVLYPEMYCKPCEWETNIDYLRWLLPRVIELTYTACDLEPFARDCGYDGPPFRWNEERRFLLRCELDAAFFHLYLGTEEEWNQTGTPELLRYFPTPRHAVDYIMDTFPIVKRKDEAAHGSYRTKGTILSIYDAMSDAIRTGQPYQTILDPPAADPSVAHPLREITATYDPSFPQTEREKLLCAITLEFVRTSKGIPDILCLDSLFFATHPNHCETLITETSIADLKKTINNLPNAILLKNVEQIGWQQIRDHLERVQAIAIERHGEYLIKPGSEFNNVLRSLPVTANTIAEHALNAARQMHKIPADSQDQKIIQIRNIRQNIA